MAITIITSPNDWQNVFNEIVFGVSGSNSTQPNYQFLCDVNVSGHTNPVSRLTYPKQPSSGQVSLDVANVLKNYVTHDFGSFNASGYQSCLNSVVKYWLGFGEVYDVSGIPTIYANQTSYGASGSPKSASNAIFGFLEWSKTAFSTNKLLSISNNVSLNQSVFTDKIRANQQRFLNFFDKNASLNICELTVYDSAENIIGSGSFSMASPGGIVSVNVGYQLFNQLSVSGLMSNPSAYSYQVRFADSGDDTLFLYEALIDSECTKYDVYRLHWLNPMGGFDAFNFTKVSRKNDEIERFQYKKLKRLGYSASDWLKTNYATKYSESVVINTDLLSDAEYAGLENLILSPVVYLEVDKDTYVPVNIRETNYEKRKYVNEQAIPNLTITIEYTFDNYRQSL